MKHVQNALYMFNNGVIDIDYKGTKCPVYV